MSGGQTLWCVDYIINKAICQANLLSWEIGLTVNLFKSLFIGFYFDVSIKPNSERRDKNEPKLQRFLLSCNRCCSDSFAIRCVTHSLEIVRHYYCEQCVVTGLDVMMISSVTRCLRLMTSTPDEDCTTTTMHTPDKSTEPLLASCRCWCAWPLRTWGKSWCGLLLEPLCVHAWECNVPLI